MRSILGGLSGAIVAATIWAGPASSPAAAQPAYPSQTIKFIVPYAAGGSSDTRARQLAQKLNDSLGVPVIVENKPGASGNIGTAQIATAKPDGYTIGLGNFAPMAINKSLYTLTFDPLRDLEPIALIERGPMVVGVNSQSSYKTIDELIAAAKANPEKLNYASTGAGSASHLGTELFKSLAGIRATHVPYRGGAPAVNDLIVGSVDFYLELPSLLLGNATGDSPRLRLLAVASEKRVPGMPNVPTFRERGLNDMLVSNWFGVIAPKGLPAEISQKLNHHINEALRDPGYRKIVEEQGGEVAGGTSDAFRSYIAAESERWTRLIREQGITVQ